METKIHVLLTGASGTIGTEIIRQLVSLKNVRLTVFDMKTSRSLKQFRLWKEHINVIWGDISDPDDVMKIPDKLDVVIHLAAIIPPLADEKPELARRVNVQGTLNLIRQLRKTSPHVFLFYSSSIAVYGDHILNPEISVDDSLNARSDDVYAQTKIDSERLIRKSDLSWSVFRLTAIMKNHKISPLMFHMPLLTRMEICTPADTARAFVNAIQHRRELEYRVFNLGGGPDCYCTYRDFLDRSFQIYGLGKADFPEHAFAERNFHCGIYVDGDVLEEILHFRKDSLDSYFEDQKRSTAFFFRLSGFLFSPLIKYYLLSRSEPFRAYKTKNESLMNLFFFPQAKQTNVLTT